MASVHPSLYSACMFIIGALSHVSTHKYFYVFVHVASFRLGHVSHLSSLFGRPSRYPGASCSDYLRCRPALTSLIASNLFWYARPYPTNTRLTYGTFPILTSTSVGARLEERQAISWRATWHNPNYPAEVMIALSLLRDLHYKGQLSTVEPSFTTEHYKNPTIIEHEEDTEFSLSLSLSL